MSDISTDGLLLMKLESYKEGVEDAGKLIAHLIEKSIECYDQKISELKREIKENK